MKAAIRNRLFQSAISDFSFPAEADLSPVQNRPVMTMGSSALAEFLVNKSPFISAIFAP
jgi:hypothetical protein